MHFDHRVREEFYELASDSDCRENLIGYTEQQQIIEQTRSKLASELLRIGDPVGPLLLGIENEKLVTLFMEQEDQRSREHQEKNPGHGDAVSNKDRPGRAGGHADPAGGGTAVREIMDKRKQLGVEPDPAGGGTRPSWG